MDPFSKRPWAMFALNVVSALALLVAASWMSFNLFASLR